MICKEQCLFMVVRIVPTICFHHNVSAVLYFGLHLISSIRLKVVIITPRVVGTKDLILCRAFNVILWTCT